MVYQYSARSIQIKVTPIISGGGLIANKALQITGYGEDEFLTITLDDDDFATTVGADGLIVRSSNYNPVASATLTLQQTSESNFYLEKLRQLDKAIMGAGLFKLDVIQPNVAAGGIGLPLGSQASVSALAWVESQADYSYGKEAGERAWTLKLADPEFESSLAVQLFNAAGRTVRGVTSMVDIISATN